MKSSPIWWEHVASPKSFPQLKSTEETEVIVVGAGIHGVVASYLLAKAGKKVVLVDKYSIASGDTQYTTAFISYLIDADLQELTTKFDEEKIKQVIESCQLAIDTIETIIRDEGIECEFERLPLTTFALDEEGKEYLQKEYEIGQKLGLPLTLSDGKDFSFANHGVMSAANHAKFHPLKFITQLLEKCQQLDVQIYESTFAQEIEHGEKVKVKTETGTIIADYVIGATHAPVTSTFLVQTKITAYNTFVIAGTLPKNSITEGLYIDTASPYHYLRVDEQPDSMRFLLGGEDQPTGKSSNTDQVFAKLEKYFQEHITNDYIITHRWGGQVLVSIDGLPYIGRHPLYKNEYMGTCFAGDGMPFGILSVMINSDLVLGRENAYAKLYDPLRFKGLKQFLKQNLKYPHELIEQYIQKERDDSVADVQPGEGKIIKRNGKQIAVYKDETGKVISLSAVCTHLGCIVNWNGAQKSWDCPCHGSRFSQNGEVLRGPATRPLNEERL